MKTSSVSVGAFEAKNRFSDLIDRVARGAEVTITKHDRPVAKIVPPSNQSKETRRHAVADLRDMRARYALTGVSVRELINDGRR